MYIAVLIFNASYQQFTVHLTYMTNIPALCNIYWLSVIKTDGVVCEWTGIEVSRHRLKQISLHARRNATS